jgi:hypothetical protein
MGVMYSVFPVDDQVRRWLVDEGISAPNSNGRAPTPNEIKAALETLDDQAVSYNIGHGVWQARIDDVTSPETGPWTLLNVSEFTDVDAPCRFYFEKGWPELIVKVAHRIARISGPVAIVPDTGCPPAVVEATSDIDDVIGTWEHLTG